jgi:hypothetical protein
LREEDRGGEKVAVTDGERLVWAASYAIALDRAGDSVAAVRAATSAITQLREAAIRRASDGSYVISQIDERDFIDEMVSAP